MDTRRLFLLLELSRLGSMREVADTHALTTSTVSQQVAALARETGVALVEREGRGVRLTPAGRRLAEHAVEILAAVEAAERDLDPEAEPAGTVRVGGFSTAVRRSLVPVVAGLRETHPAVAVLVSEYEPIEALRRLSDDDLDLALTYDYDLAPAPPGPLLVREALWRTTWGLGVPTAGLGERDGRADLGPADLARWGSEPWIVNSRNTADEEAVRTLAATTGFEPWFAHSIDSLELVQELVEAGLGVGLLPRDVPTRPGVTVLPLPGPGVVLTAYAVTRRGRERWSPLRAVLDRLVHEGALTGGTTGR